MADDRKSREERSRARQIGVLTAVPATLLAGPLVGGFLGRLLDTHFGTGPWGLLVCLGLGFAASGVEVGRLLKLANQDEPPDGPGDAAGPRTPSADARESTAHTTEDDR